RLKRAARRIGADDRLGLRAPFDALCGAVSLTRCEISLCRIDQARIVEIGEWRKRGIDPLRTGGQGDKGGECADQYANQTVHCGSATCASADCGALRRSSMRLVETGPIVSSRLTNVFSI